MIWVYMVVSDMSHGVQHFNRDRSFFPLLCCSKSCHSPWSQRPGLLFHVLFHQAASDTLKTFGHSDMTGYPAVLFRTRISCGTSTLCGHTCIAPVNTVEVETIKYPVTT